MTAIQISSAKPAERRRRLWRFLQWHALDALGMHQPQRDQERKRPSPITTTKAKTAFNRLRTGAPIESMPPGKSQPLHLDQHSMPGKPDMPSM